VEVVAELVTLHGEGVRSSPEWKELLSLAGGGLKARQVTDLIYEKACALALDNKDKVLHWLDPVAEVMTSCELLHWLTRCGRYRVSKRTPVFKDDDTGVAFLAMWRDESVKIGDQWRSAEPSKRGAGYLKCYRSLREAFEGCERKHVQATGVPATSNLDEVVAHSGEEKTVAQVFVKDDESANGATAPAKAPKEKKPLSVPRQKGPADDWGNTVGSQANLINEAIKAGKTLWEDIAAAAGLSVQRVRSHGRWLEGHGRGEVTKEGFRRK
jgi:hypothetical protein